MKLKVLVVQNSAIIGNKEATLNNISRLLVPYTNEKFDLIILPEVFSIGWDCSRFHELAESIDDSKSIDFLKEIAQEHKSLVIGGSIVLKTENSTHTNTCVVVSPKGKIITTYNKMHLFSHTGSEENKYITTGNELKLLNYGDTKIGISICYDIRFPEIYRCYSQNGAEVIINVAAWSKTKPEHWDIMHKARAIENQCFVIAANQTGLITKNEQNLGHSMIISPWGTSIAELQEEEGCLSLTIDTNLTKEFRQNFPLLKDRRDNIHTYFDCKEIDTNV